MNKLKGKHNRLLINQATEGKFANMIRHSSVRNYFYKCNQGMNITRNNNPGVNTLGVSFPSLTNRTEGNVFLCALEHIKLEKRNKQ